MTAAQEVLATPFYRDQARQRSAVLAGIDGAANAADEVEALIPMRATAAQQCQQVA